MPEPEERLVVALDPQTPETTRAVKAAITRFAADLNNPELLEGVIEAVEHPDGVGLPDLCRRAGITERQGDHWTRLGLLVQLPRPPGAGHGYPRKYPPETIVKARIMGSLVRLFTMAPTGAATVAEEIIANGAATVGGYRITKRVLA